MSQNAPSRHPLTHLRHLLAATLLGSGLLLGSAPSTAAMAAPPAEGRIDRHVSELMGQGQRVRVIVVGRDNLNSLEGALHRAGAGKVVRVPLLHGLATDLNPLEIQRLSSNTEVVRVVYDAPVRLSDSSFDLGALLSTYPAILDSSPVLGGTAPLTGKGVGVAVIDSGVALHPDLNGRVVLAKNFNPSVSDGDDAYGHGTAVAGIIAGNGSASGGQYIGVAPEANLVNLRVNDGSGAAPTSTILNAILWAVNNRAAYNIRVMNLSLSASVEESYLTSPIDAAVEYAWLKGIVVVVAAGNNGPNSALFAPANDPFVITVGATDDHGTTSLADDSLATFSSFGVTQDGVSKPDLVAPGRHIVTTLAANSSFATNYSSYQVGSQYIRLSGTSMAAPMVSGVAALYLESHPGVRPNQLKALLSATARPLGVLGTGAGYPDALRAINHPGLVGNANHGIDPNNFLKVMYMQANNLQSLPSVSWDSVSWDSVSWDSVSWDSIAWNAVSWDS